MLLAPTRASNHATKLFATFFRNLLARIAPMRRDQKRAELEKMSTGRPPYSYQPMRQSILDILNITPGPLVTLPRTPWPSIADDIRRRSRKLEEIDANLRTAEGLYIYASDHKLVGRRHDFLPFKIGLSEQVVYWSPVVMEVDGRPTVPFFDPRRTKGLTSAARQFVFSVMHERIRVLDPDLADARLAIFRFENSDRGPRAPVPYFDHEVVLLSFEMLDSMVRETYALWDEVLREREAAMRRRAGGASGSLL